MTGATSTGRGRAAAAALSSVLVVGLPAQATDAPGPAAALFREADLALGDKLVREHKCSECHARRVGGDGAAIYRPLGRINTPAALRGMVDQCSLELNLALFPDEVTSISAVLNRDHYRFK